MGSLYDHLKPTDEMPETAKYWAALGYLEEGWQLREQGNLQSAVAKLEEIQNLMPIPGKSQNNDILADSLALAGCIWGDQRNFKEAIIRLEKSVKLVPNNPDYWVTYGLALFNDDQYDQALTAFTKAKGLGDSRAEKLIQQVNEAKNPRKRRWFGRG